MLGYHRLQMDRISPSMKFDDSNLTPWRRKLKQKLKQCMGFPHNQGVPRGSLRVRTIWKRDHPLGSIQRIVFNAEPGADVAAYLCLPANVSPPYPWFICVQGHSTGMHNSIAVDYDTESKTIEIQGDRDFGLGCMKRGIAALCIEQRSFGYRREAEQANQPNGEPHGGFQCVHPTCRALLLGSTLLAERVFDVDRALDLLWTRQDVDRTRVGVMGNSGGGTVSIYAAALLDRLTHAMPSCSFCTFRDSIMSIHHCPDQYVPGLFRYADMADILGLFAPKPVVVVNGKDDKIFPIKPAKREFQRLQAIYKAAGAADHCRFVVGHEGHRFYADAAWDAMMPLLGPEASV